MDQRGRLRINLTQREFEVEGSEEFVRSFADRIQELLDQLDVPLPPPAAPAREPAAADPGSTDLGTFGETPAMPAVDPIFLPSGNLKKPSTG